jgi:integrase
VLWIPDSKTEAGKRTVKVPAVLQPHLRALCRDKLPLALLFGEHDRDWPRHWVKRICRLAKLPEVCAHSMRGLHATLAIEAGASPDVVARSLGHESAAMTLSAYAAPGSAESATANRVHDLLASPPK